MTKAEKTADRSQLTWTQVCKWVGILYAVSLFGFLIKATSQIGYILYENVWQLAAVVILPFVYMFWFFVVALLYLATKKFDVSKAEGFMTAIAWIYVVFVALRLVSGRPI